MEKLRVVDLGEEVLNRWPAELSGGMRKRVGLARGIALEPQILLYDESTTGLDPANQRRIGELIRSLQQRLGVTSVVVTHELELCFAISDDVALIRAGRIEACGTAQEMRTSSNPAVQDFLAGKQNAGSEGEWRPARAGSACRRGARSAPAEEKGWIGTGN